jgi:hypothetical protein
MGTLKYRQAHRKELVEKARIYAQTHKEQIAEYQRKYRAEHKQQQRAYIKKWKQQNPERKRELNKKWQDQHPEYFQEYKKKWNHTKQGKLNQHRKNTRRKAYRRKYGSNLLNQPFKGSVGHHIDKETVVYIPEEIHLSVKHNLRRNINMEQINTFALEWFNMQKSAITCRKPNLNSPKPF